MFEKTLAALVVLVCAALLLRLALSERRRQRLDAAAHRLWHGARHRARQAWGWRGRRRESARQADAAIRHAAGREGNVIRPKSFKRPRKPH